MKKFGIGLKEKQVFLACLNMAPVRIEQEEKLLRPRSSGHGQH